MSYVAKLHNGANPDHLKKEIIERLHNAGDQIGTQIVGTTPKGVTVRFQRAFFEDDSRLELYYGGHTKEFEGSDTDALAVIDARFARSH